jgi:hypothetical protein
LTSANIAAGGMIGSPPRSSIQAKATAMTTEMASLTPCFCQKPGWGAGSLVTSTAMRSPNIMNSRPALSPAGR